MNRIKKGWLFCLVLCLLTLCAVCFASAAKAPAKGTGTCRDGALEIRWSKAAGAVEYELFKQDSKGHWIKKTQTAACSFLDEKVKDGKTYHYRVRALDEISESAFRSFDVRYLAPPQINSFKNRAGGIEVRWDACKAADTVRVYRLDDSGTWRLLSVVSGRDQSYLDPNVQGGKKYCYTLRQTSNGQTSAYHKGGVKHVFVSQITSLVARNSPNGISLSWDQLPEAKGYYVYRKAAGESGWKRIRSLKTGSSAFLDAAPPFGKRCSYAVSANRTGKNVGARSRSAMLYAVDPQKPMVALTYDDGPNASTTNQILDSLEAHGARATFFVVGERLSYSKTVLKREASLGCEIGCHTYSHADLTTISDEKIQSEISSTCALVKSITGQRVRVVRPPYGAVNDHVASVIPYPLVNWSVDTLDWQHRNTARTVSSVLSGVKNGSIVLMHDIHAPTANAAEQIVSTLTERGFQLVTVSEMMDARGVVFQSGQVYRNAY